MDSNTSRAIDITRILAIVMVVALHARTGLQFASTNSGSLADLISRGLGSLGVPLFLFISGFLAAARPKGSSWTIAIRGIMKRISDLAAIYVLWNILVAIAVLLMLRFGMAPGNFLLTRLNDGVAGIFGFNSQFPIAYQFWFIRELILISLIVGCVGGFTKDQRVLFVAFCILILLTGLFLDPRTLVSVIAYCVGYWFGRYRAESAWPSYSPTVLQKAFVLALLFSVILLILCVKTSDWTGLYLNLFVVTGMASVLSGTLIMAPYAKSAGWSFAAEASFFVFAAHEPFLTAAKKVIATRFPVEIVYSATPVAIILALFTIYALVPTTLKDMLWFIFRGSRRRARAQAHHIKSPALR